MKIVTHNSRFHSDDIFASAVCLLMYPDATITRSRDPAIISKADIVFDVGTMYDPEKNRFDHHQEGGAGKRDNGIPYASFGLVWKKFGEQLAGSKEAADFIDTKLVQPIDAMDNGMNLYTPLRPDVNPYVFQNITGVFNPTWKESDDSKEIDARFFKLVDIAKYILEREIIHAQDFISGNMFVKEAYEKAEDKRIIILDGNYPWDMFMTKHPEVLYVVKPSVQDSNWKVEAARDSVFSYEMRKKLPASWAGKRDGELAEASGVPDATFCHNGRFLAVAKSKEGALKLADIALKS